MRILVVGDSYMPPRYFQIAFTGLERVHEIAYFQIDADRADLPVSLSLAKLEEYQGSPSEVAERMSDVEVLVVQAAPISEEVLRAAPHLKLVACARGGPVNVDVDAVTARGLPLVSTPGKNADAVADQTIAFLVMLARGFPKAQRFLLEGNQLKDNWEGAKFIGNDLRRHTLGLVGYGRVGQRVASRARAFGMAVIVYDPYLSKAPEEAEQVGAIDELLSRADFVSLHARATAETANMIDAAAIAKMQPGSFLVNTARESLVDEDALDAALESRHLAGAALDVVHFSSQPGIHRLLRHENVVMTPHIGGGTHETLLQGAEMIAAEIVRFAAGEPLVNVVNRTMIDK